MWRKTFSCAALVLLTLGCATHPSHVDTSTPTESAGVFSSDVSTTAKPWTHLNFKNDPNAFQFAIVTDRTGGGRTGVFSKAVDRLNWMQPEFVVSVGDLIEGYTKDEPRLEKEWAEFQGWVAALEMPFFYLPGNHDITNPVMRDLWHKKFGPTYYSFVYRDVLFICLDTQDGTEDGKGIFKAELSRKQIDYVRDVLAKHADARWTFVLMHQPLWLYDEGDVVSTRKVVTEKQNTGFAPIQQALRGRKHTVIAGHFHDYVKYERENVNYYVLATTGGVSKLRGPQFGEFDQVVWVTMTDKGPLMANLSLDGIMPEDLRDEDQMRFQNAMAQAYEEIALMALTEAERRARRVAVAYEGITLTVPADGSPLQQTLTLPVVNPLGQGVRAIVTWTLPENGLWHVEPEQAQVDVSAFGRQELSFEVTYTGPVSPVHAMNPLPKVIISAKTPVKIVLENHTIQPRLEAREYLKNHLPTLSAQSTEQAPVIDGQLDEPTWRGKADIDSFIKLKVTGIASARTRAWIRYDQHALYVAMRCNEPNLEGLVTNATGHDGDAWADDGVEIFIDIDNDRQKYHHFTVTAANATSDSFGREEKWNGQFTSAVKMVREGYVVEFAVPWATLGLEGPPAAGSYVGFNLLRNRIQAGSEASQWSPTPPKSSHQPELFGRLAF